MTHAYEDAEGYRNNNELQFHFAMKALSGVTLNKTDRILDLGCGDGLITSKLAESTTGCVIGTDISEQMISLASKTYASHSNLGFMCMDASRNVFDNQFDLVTSFNALHWVKDQESALAGIAKAATPKATILLLFSHKKSLYHQTLDQICASEAWKNYFIHYINPRSFYDIETYRQMLENAGLKVVSLTEETMTYHFDTIEKLRGFLRTSMANVKEVPSEKNELFFDDFINVYMQHLGETLNGKIPLAFWCLIVHATKFEI